MRIPTSRVLAVLATAALIAVGCSDDPAGEEPDDGLGSATSTTQEGPEGATTLAPVDPPPDAFEIPIAPAPDPDPTPLPLSREYRIDTLDNGLTYLLRSNDTPGSSLDLRLVVDAGSLQQADGLDGSAHFLEHMMFNGTEAFPANELTDRLRQLGISFGADVNAYTSYDETVYLLGAPTFDPAAVDTAFEVLREWASRATISPVEVEAEIGVVRDELRQGRESVDGIIFTRFEEIYTRGTPYEGHLVIGDPALVEATDADNLRGFYEDWYRPDNMAVVLVGDLPLDTLEAEVVARFADLENPADAPAALAPVVVELDPEPVTEVIVHPDTGAPYLSLDIPLPVWDLGTVGGERLSLVEAAVRLMLDQRLGEAFQRGDLDTDQQPFMSDFAINRGLRYYGSHLRAPELDVALDQFMGQLLLAALDGFTEDDVARVREVLLAALEDRSSTLGTIQDFEYASALSSYFLEGASPGLDENSLRRQRGVIENLGADELTDYWRWILQSSGPVVIAVGPDGDMIPTADRLREVLDEARPAGAGAVAESIDELMAPPDPAATTDERSWSFPGGTVEEWTFENGVVVSYQQTTITEGSFDIWMESTGGWSALDDPNLAMAGAAVDAVLASGVGPHDPVTLERYLESRDVNLFASIDETQEGFYGHASTSDAEDMFALAHMMMTEPRVDDVALRSVARAASTLLEASDDDPDLRATQLLLELLAGGDERYEILLDQADIDALDGAELLAIFEDRFATPDDLHVAIVGDIDVDEAFDLAARYLGTLPTGAPDSWVDLGVELPARALTGEVVLTDGTANGGLTRFDWVIGEVDAADEVTAVLLSTIITNRITDDIRETLGASYGGSAAVQYERADESVISSYVQVNGDPSRLDEIRSALDTILDHLVTDGPTEDEFDRAVQATANDYNFVNDVLFLSTNLALTRFPEQDVLLPADRFTVLGRVTRADVAAMAAALYGDPASVEVSKVLP